MKKLFKNLIKLVIIVIVLFAVYSFLSGFFDDEEDYDEDYGGYYSEDYGQSGTSDSRGDSEEGDWNVSYDENGQIDIGEGNYNVYTGSLFPGRGSANEMEGTTVLVSIFADDNTTQWESGDDSLKDKSLNSLRIATEYLTSNVASYGCNAKFVYDWKENSDLYYETKLKCTYTNADDDTDMDTPTWEFIEAQIDTAALMKKYGGDNVIFIVYLNTPDSNTRTSCTRTYYDYVDYPYEVCYMYMFTDGELETPSAYAHEILHTFGAPDLYMADEDGYNCGITQEYVNMLENTYSNDIMFTTYDAETSASYYDYISNEFTEIDAYYVGITDYSQVVEEWGFGTSEHQ